MWEMWSVRTRECGSEGRKRGPDGRNKCKKSVVGPLKHRKNEAGQKEEIETRTACLAARWRIYIYIYIYCILVSIFDILFTYCMYHLYVLYMFSFCLFNLCYIILLAFPHFSFNNPLTLPLAGLGEVFVYLILLLAKTSSTFI